ncbi:DUF4382 domain-containing protein [Mariniphaga sediminis]|uniref:DUF4382 domain-containing protein n=1 Tax=Mariniphaga sediminis TaxID=1628158 RepID=A0A399D1Y9_9BACT|nr:DUF4382 domain-containing protein [Mariniphaga sediminis]RIH64701.1 DUF4382 domain-containing protein [Mariniphaga sediminis]
MMKRKNFFVVVIILFSAVLFVQCSKDDLDGKEKGMLSVKITDAPSDDMNIQGTFVTVSDIKIDGKSVEGFTSQTIEVSAYQNGNAKLLVDNEEVAANTYNSVTLVLDHENDASGESPGCYVLTEDGTKHNLFAETSTESEVTVSKEFVVESGMETSLVIDFDLRKAVVRIPESSGESEYKFVTTAELKNSLRVVNEDECGEVSGKVDSFNAENQTYVFIYNKGEFETSAESSGSGESNVLFAKAVTSSKVGNGGVYKLSFVEEGDYEVHVVSFEKTTDENKFSFKGILNANSKIGGLLLNDVSVSADSTVELDIEILGLL